MSTQSEIQAAEGDIRAALESGPEAMQRMIDAYCSRPEAEKLSFVAALVGRVVVSAARHRAA